VNKRGNAVLLYPCSPGGGPSICTPYSCAAVKSLSISSGACGGRVRACAGSAAARMKPSCGGLVRTRNRAVSESTWKA